MATATIIGGGVSGLTSAIRLAEEGHQVRVVARDYGTGTTSWVATAIWHLFWVEVDERVERWAAEALGELLRLANDEPSAGVTRVRGIECVREGTPEADDFLSGRTHALWKQVVPSYEPLERDQLVSRLPPGYPVDQDPKLLGGYTIEVPIADMSVYLPYLYSRLDDLGVERTHDTIVTFEDARERYPADWIINCTGLGARELAADDQLKGIKGQIARVTRDGTVTEYIADDFSPAGMTYILPRGSDIVLGGSEDQGVENSDVDPKLAADILRRCADLVPALAAADVLEHLAGVRPYRSSIRLERDGDQPDLVHNYGHGGSGVSLSWGCAQEVLTIVGGERRENVRRR